MFLFVLNDFISTLRNMLSNILSLSARCYLAIGKKMF